MFGLGLVDYDSDGSIDVVFLLGEPVEASCPHLFDEFQVVGLMNECKTVWVLGGKCAGH